MPLTNNIVDYINGYLAEGSLKSDRFQPMKLHGTATTVQFENEEKGFIAPGVINAEGEIREVLPDDIYHLQIYHKTISNTYSERKQGSYGDQLNIQSTTEMQLFVFAQSDKIKMTAEDLEPIVVFGMPDNLNASNMISCKVVVVSSDMDKYRNGKQEFQNVPNFLKPEHIFFSIRYQIRKVFTKACVDACLCNN